MQNNNLKLCCVYGKYDTEPKIVTPQSVEHLFESTRSKLELYHKTGDEKYKFQLTAILFNGVYDHEAYKADRAKGSAESARSDKYFLPSPFIGLDIDLDGAKELFEQVKEKVKEKLGCDFSEKIVMAYETPSGRLRVIALRRKGTSIEEDLKYWEDIIELPCDPKCVNTSRLFFLVPQEYVFHLDPEKLFALLEAHNPNDYKSEEKVEPTMAMQQDNTLAAKSNLANYITPKYSKNDLSSIARELEFQLNGGPAQEGNRNTLTFDMAKWLRYLTGDDEELLSEIIPQYEVNKMAHRKAIGNALKYAKKVPYTPLVLQRAIDRAMHLGTEETNQKVEGEDLPPAMPKYLPDAMNCILASTPEKCRAAVAMAVFAPLRCLLHGVEFVYIDNKPQEPCFINLTIADQGSGKASLREPTKAILHSVAEEDARARQEEEDWREAMSTLGANDKKPATPKTAIRIVQANMTDAALVMRAKRSNGYSLYTYAEEVEKLWKKVDFSEVARNAFDGEEYGQERTGAGSQSGVAKLLWSVVCATTPGKARQYLHCETTDGLLTRMALSTMIDKKDDWGEETPMYGKYDEEYTKAVDEFTKQLKEMPVGKFICQEAIDWAIAEKMRQIDKFRLMDAKYMLPYLWRGLKMAFWRGCILYIMHDKKWSPEIENFITWTLNYDLWCKMHFFGSIIESNTEKDNGIKTNPRSLINLLGDTFSKEDAITIRQRVGKSIDNKKVRDMLNQWKKRGFITQDDAGMYHKTNRIPVE